MGNVMKYGSNNKFLGAFFLGFGLLSFLLGVFFLVMKYTVIDKKFNHIPYENVNAF